MPESVFPYPGGKTNLSYWVLDHLPDHKCYVEPFAGSASVLLNKDRSKTEVVNDRDGDITHFFTTLRDQGDELREWLAATPFSRQLHDEYATAYFDGFRPDDDIERAGRWFFLRHTQFASKYNGISGFKTSPKTNTAGAFANNTDDLEKFATRLRGVVIENKDYADVVDLYDTPETVFYFDPPYVHEGDALYTGGDFDHERLVETLAGIEGKWLVSYTDLPDGLVELAAVIIERVEGQMMNRAREDRRTDERTERLVMNFDPENEAAFSAPGSQATVADF